MKKLLIILTSGIVLNLCGSAANAQSFVMAHDTVLITTGGTVLTTFPDSVNNLTGSDLALNWKVIGTDFPADWKDASGFCDPFACYSDLNMWPVVTTKNFSQASGLAPFYLSIDFPLTTSTGCYYTRVLFTNPAIATDTATATFIVCKTAVAVANVANERSVTITPNPAQGMVHIQYDRAAGVKEIAVYDMVGRQVFTQAATGETRTTINLEAMMPGMYFVRLFNSRGDVIVTKQITKQ
ncbi:MAG: T9SS type A sorting domain-containing protein [Taibaiella sp.]|nr:T9SS type A sorting domain-containing protein [Taibaiella sp.]